MGKYFDLYLDYVEKLQDREIVLFGAGNHTKKILSPWCEGYLFKKDEISFICDNDSSKWGDEIFGIPVYSPEKLLENPDKYVVLITVLTDGKFNLKRIMQQLKYMKIPNVYPIDILEYTFVNAWRHNPLGKVKYHEKYVYKFIEENKDKIEKLRELLADRKSKQLLDEYVFRIKYNMKDYRDLTDGHYDSYFSDDIFDYEDEEILVDGGCFDGADTIWFNTMLENEGKKLKKAYCFDPDIENYSKTIKKLVKEFDVKDAKINMYSFETDKFNIYRYGLYSKSDEARFNEFGDDSSTIKNNGTESIKVVKLDDILDKDENITMMAWDLEGSEYDAIKGAEKTIKRCKPKIAICIYHKVEDLWEIPFLIKSIVPEYKFYIRHHNSSMYDKILYAVSEK